MARAPGPEKAVGAAVGKGGIVMLKRLADSGHVFKNYCRNMPVAQNRPFFD